MCFCESGGQTTRGGGRTATAQRLFLNLKTNSTQGLAVGPPGWRSDRHKAKQRNRELSLGTNFRALAVEPRASGQNTPSGMFLDTPGGLTAILAVGPPGTKFFLLFSSLKRIGKQILGFDQLSNTTHKGFAI